MLRQASLEVRPAEAPPPRVPLLLSTVGGDYGGNHGYDRTISNDNLGAMPQTWTNVGFGLALILIDVGISTVFRLEVVLQQVSENKNPWLVALISCKYFPLSLQYVHTKDITVVLNFLGTFETGLSHVFHHGFLQLTRDV